MEETKYIYFRLSISIFCFKLGPHHITKAKIRFLLPYHRQIVVLFWHSTSCPSTASVTPPPLIIRALSVLSLFKQRPHYAPFPDSAALLVHSSLWNHRFDLCSVLDLPLPRSTERSWVTVTLSPRQSRCLHHYTENWSEPPFVQLWCCCSAAAPR